MSNLTVHVWRMVATETPSFAASDTLVACTSPDEDEARTRAGWSVASPSSQVSAEYLGEMTNDEFYRRLAAHQSTGR